MLLPFQCPDCGKRLFIELKISYEERTYLNSINELKEYVLKEANIIEIHEFEELAYKIRQDFAEMINKGENWRRALKILSEVYGIPILVLEELLSDLIDQIKVVMT